MPSPANLLTGSSRAALHCGAGRHASPAFTSPASTSRTPLRTDAMRDRGVALVAPGERSSSAVLVEAPDDAGKGSAAALGALPGTAPVDGAGDVQPARLHHLANAAQEGQGGPLSSLQAQRAIYAPPLRPRVSTPVVRRDLVRPASGRDAGAADLKKSRKPQLAAGEIDPHAASLLAMMPDEAGGSFAKWNAIEGAAPRALVVTPSGRRQGDPVGIRDYVRDAPTVTEQRSRVSTCTGVGVIFDKIVWTVDEPADAGTSAHRLLARAPRACRNMDCSRPDARAMTGGSYCEACNERMRSRLQSALRPASPAPTMSPRAQRLQKLKAAHRRFLAREAAALIATG